MIPLATPTAAQRRAVLWLQAVQLALQCLSFDFVGTCLDESSEDLGTIQVPSGEPPMPTRQRSARSPPTRTHVHRPHTPPPPCCTAWRPSIEDPSTLQLFIDFYCATQPPLSSMALECLVSASRGPA